METPLVRGPADDLDTPPLDADGAPRPAPRWAGQQLGRYLVLDRLGAGGMGEVYRAYDPELDRGDALKVLRRDRDAGPDGEDRLLREAQALARLTHPNVVTVHDVGRVEIGDDSEPAVYVAMEYIEGKTLQEWVADQTSWRPIVRAFRAAGAGLAAAHAQDIVHRDFKPANVLVGDDGRVRVLDFGLARKVRDAPLVSSSEIEDSLDRPMDGTETATASRVSLDAALTETGTLLGTPAYMSPEQFTGRRIDGRSDQYSFCVALHEALFGVRPFSARNPREMVRAIRRQRFADPKKSMHVPARVRAAIRRGLAYEPDERHHDMNRLLAALDRALAPVPRAAIVVGAIGVAGAAAVWATARDGGETPCQGADAHLAGVWDDARRAALGEALHQRQVPDADDLARRVDGVFDAWTAAWVDARTEACVATRVRGEQSEELLELRVACLDDRLHDLDALVTALGEAEAAVIADAVQTALQLPSLDPCADREYLRAAQRPPDDPEVARRVDALRDEASIVWATLATGRAAQAADAGLDLLVRTRELEYDPLRAQVARITSQALEHAGRNDEVLPVLEESLLAAERSGQRYAVAEALIGYSAHLGYQRGEQALALRYGAHADAVLDHIGRPNTLVGALELTLGNISLSSGRPDAAIEHYQRALELPVDDVLTQRHRLAAGINLASAHGTQGDYERALSAFSASAERARELLGDGHPTYATAMMNVGATELQLGHLDEAAAALDVADARLVAALGPKHPNVGRLRQNQGEVLAAQGKLDAAVERFEEGLALKKEGLGPTHPSVATTLSSLGGAYLRQGRYTQAEAVLREAIAAWEGSVGPEHPEIAGASVRLGRTLLALERPADAIAPLERGGGLLGEAASPRDRFEQEIALARALHETGGDPVRVAELARSAEAHLRAAGDATDDDRARLRAVRAPAG